MKRVFGPNPTRRFGLQLRIDPVPVEESNMNCVYCCSNTPRPYVFEPKEYVLVEEIVSELKEALDHVGMGTIDYIVIQGSGETTLFRKLGELMDAIRKTCSIPIAVRTNGTLLIREDIRRALRRADVVMPTFDAASEDLYQRINRPYALCPYHYQLEGLCLFSEDYQGRLWPQVTLVRGLNDTERALRELEAIFELVRPDAVHLLLPNAEYSEDWVRPPDEEGLMRAVAILGKSAKVIHPTEGELLRPSYETVERGILSYLRRHPMTQVELDRTLTQWAPGSVGTALYALERGGDVREIERFGTVFWCPSQARYPPTRKAEYRMRN